jgi:hypothetical protein
MTKTLISVGGKEKLMEFETISDVVSQLKTRHYEMRPLRLDDYEKGFLDCLSSLTVVGPVTKMEFEGTSARFGRHFIVFLLYESIF